MILVSERLTYPRGLLGNNIYMFTANSTIRKNGCLVMGAGSAKAARDTYVGIDKKFGGEIQHLSKFGIEFVRYAFGNTEYYQTIGAFQTKRDWQHDSPMDLLHYSTRKLAEYAEQRPAMTFHLPCPAVGCGGQSVDDVLSVLELLPDNVIVYLDK